MKKIIKMLRPFDVVIVFLLILLSFAPSAVFSAQYTGSETAEKYAVISIDGEEVDRFLLTGNKENRLITYHPAPDQYNIIEIDGERIRNREDNSPQQISVRTGWIQEPGQTSLNLRHRLLIEIISEDPSEYEIDALVQ